MDPIVIVGAARTPMGGFLGDFKDVSRAASWARAPSPPRWSAPGFKGEDAEEVVMGCVLPAGQGQAPARQAALGRRACRKASARPPSTRCAAPA